MTHSPLPPSGHGFSTSDLSHSQYLRPRQICQRFGIPRDRVYCALQQGDLPAVNFGSPRKASYYVLLEDVLAWLERLKGRGPQ